MHRLIVLLFLVGCAATDHTELCNKTAASAVAGAQTRHRLHDPEGAFRSLHQACMFAEADRDRRQIATGVGLVLGAAGDAAFSVNVQRGFDGRFHHRR